MGQCSVDLQSNIIRTVKVITNKTNDVSLLNKLLFKQYQIDINEMLKSFDSNNVIELKNIFKLKNIEYIDPTKKVTKETAPLSTKNDIVSDFQSTEVADLFHTMHVQKMYFDQTLKESLIKAVIIGDPKDKKFVSTDRELNINIKNLKNEAFNKLRAYLGLPKCDLYNPQGTLVNYNPYINTIKIAEKLFFTENPDENRFTVKSYSGKIVPNLEGLVKNASDRKKYDAYNAAVLLVNFDNIIQNSFSKLMDIDYSAFNDFNASKDNAFKYKLNIKGIETLYWSDDSHESEGVGHFEDSMTKLIIGGIKKLNKDGEYSGQFLQINDFYRFAAEIRDFERMNAADLLADLEFNINELDHTNDWELFENNPKKMLSWYVDRILKAAGDGYAKGFKSDKYSVFNSHLELIQSIKSFLKTIEAKETQEVAPISALLTQVVTNSFGAKYYSFNAAKGYYESKELYSHNSNKIGVYGIVYNKFLKTAQEGKTDIRYNSKKISDQLDKLFENTDQIKILKGVSDIIYDKFGMHLKVEQVDQLFQKTLANVKWENIEDSTQQLTIVKEAIKGTLLKIVSDNLVPAVEAHDKVSGTKLISDIESQAKVLDPLLTTALFNEIVDIFLEDQTVVTIMNSKTSSGNNIPTFKVANLTYNDPAVIENYRKQKQTNQSYKNLYAEHKGPSFLLGTGTKLELVNQKIVKAAGKWSEGESFTSNFEYDFLRGLTNKKDGGVSIQIGNYSDKSTILTKIIDPKVIINGKHVITDGLFEGKDRNVMSTEEIKELVRTQSKDYYTDLWTDIFTNYSKVIAETGTESGLKIHFDGIKDFEKNVKIINNYLANNKDNYNKHLKQAWEKDNTVELVEELHYSKYSDGLFLNQLLIDYYRIFDSEEEFAIFSKRQEASTIAKYKAQFGSSKINFKAVADSDAVDENDNKEDVPKKYFDALNLKFDENIDNTLIENDKKEINPLVAKYLWVNSLFRNEYLFITAKGEYMHPHKAGLASRPSTKVDYDQLSLEMQGRLITMAKRNVLFTATHELPVRNSAKGVPPQINIAAIEDAKAETYNIAGKVNNQEVHDGSSLISYVYSKMVENSYPGKGYKGTKKQFGTFITNYGCVVKKDAETEINNRTIRDTNYSSTEDNSIGIKHRDKHEQMFSIPIDKVTISSIDLANWSPKYYIENGITYKISSFSIDNNVLTKNVTTKNGDTWSKSTSITTPINTLFDIWKAFGAEYSMDEKLEFNEGSNDILYDIVTNFKGVDNNYPLKQKMIHVISNKSSLKSGASRLNLKDSWNNANTLMYSTYYNKFYGPQLDANHDAEGSQIKEISQVISALAQSPSTSAIADEIYNDLATIIKHAAKPYIVSGDNTMPKIAEFVSKKFFDSVLKSDNVSLAKTIMQSFPADQQLPFSNQNFFNLFVKDIISRMNDEFITRYYSGIGAVLNPSHGMMKLFRLGGETYLQSDILKEALAEYVPNPDEIKTNDQIISEHIQKKFPSDKVTVDKIQPGDVVLKAFEQEEPRSIYDMLPPDVFITEINKPWNDDPSKSNIAQHFFLENKPNQIFELVKDLEPNNYSVHFKTDRGELLTEEERSKSILTEAEKNKLIYAIYTQLPAGAKLSTWSTKKKGITKGGISGLNRFSEWMQDSGEKRSIWFEGKPYEATIFEHKKEWVEKPYTLDTMEKYQEFKRNTKGIVTKLNHITTDLKPSEITFDIENEIKNDDVLIWAHPGIGKTFLHGKNNDIVDFDSVYKPRLNKILNLPDGVDGLQIRRDFRKNNEELYNQTILDLYDLARDEVLKSGKKLLVSDLILLKQRSSNFDKIINMSDEKFIERSAQRGETDVADKMLWKNSINEALANINSPNVITTDKYMSELLPKTLNIFDTDSIRLRYYLNSFIDGKFDGKDEDYIILNNFAVFATEKSLKEITDENTGKLASNAYIKLLDKKINAWTQRNSQLLDSGRIMNPVTVGTIFKDYFKGDNLTDIFDDVKHLYDSKSIKVFNYSFKDPELILPNIYKNSFDTGTDTVAHIRKYKEEYFAKKLNNIYTTKDMTDNDIKLILSEGVNPVYIKFVDKLPARDPNVKFSIDVENVNGEFKTVYTRLDTIGKKLYNVPETAVVVVKPEGDVIYMLSSTETKERTTKKGDVVNSKVLNKDLSSDVDTVIKSFKGELKGVQPLMNYSNQVFKMKEVDEVDEETGEVIIDENTGKAKKVEKLVLYNLNYIALNAFKTFSGYHGNVTPKDANSYWFNNNIDTIVKQLSIKTYVSWEKSLQFISARIPAQSMQSFMPMTVKGYLNTAGNDAYVSVWQIWLQGSDFDIDKSYIMGYGFDKNAAYDSWTPLANYSTVEQLNAFEQLPLPSGVESTWDTVKRDENTIDLTDTFNRFLNSYPSIVTVKTFDDELNVEQINIINDALRLLKNNDNVFIDIKADFVATAKSSTADFFMSLLNKHNKSEEYFRKKNAVKNSIVNKIRKVISTPSNQLLANDPVAVQELHDAANAAVKWKAERTPKKEPLSSWDMFSMFKQQKDASIGKDDVGVAANGLKVFFALSSYYNKFYADPATDLLTNEQLRRNNHTFVKTFDFKAFGVDKVYKIGTISDVNIPNAKIAKLNKSLNVELNVLKSQAALSTSAFTSAATDNAKELIMAKINATVELAGMHLYLLSLGVTIDEVAIIMNDQFIDDVIKDLEANRFWDVKTYHIPVILKNKLKNATAEDKLKLATLIDIYEGAQEFKVLSGLFKVNQKTSANTKELNKFLNKFETAVFSRENSVFAEDTIKLRSFGKDPSKEGKERDNAIINKILAKHSTLQDNAKDRKYITEVLNNANNVKYFVNEDGKKILKTGSLIGGNFDYRYYLATDSEDYKKATIDYYNLIKNTINVFDAVENLPHFKEMIEGVKISHNLLINSSEKYKFVFSTFRDIVRKRSNDLSKNDHLKHYLGNSAFPLKIEDKEIAGAARYFDERLKTSWYKNSGDKNTKNISYKVNPSDLTLNVKDLLALVGKDSISLYTDDSKKYNKNDKSPDALKARNVVTANSENNYTVDLLTDTGIANFKLIVENLLFDIISDSKYSKLGYQLKLSSARNVFGNNVTQIMSVFPISDLNNPVNLEKFEELLTEFNNIDKKVPKIKNAVGKELSWKDILYAYNLNVNNESYGNKRLTPLFQDYVKEKNTFGNSFLGFASKVDSKKDNILDYMYGIDTNGLESEELDNIITDNRMAFENSVLYYAFNERGELNLPNWTEKKGSTFLENINSDYIINSEMTVTSGANKNLTTLREFLQFLKTQSLIIKFKCD